MYAKNLPPNQNKNARIPCLAFIVLNYEWIQMCNFVFFDYISLGTKKKHVAVVTLLLPVVNIHNVSFFLNSVTNNM